MGTEKLYYHDSYLSEFTAKILRVNPLASGEWGVVLDRTAFYPESGGQPFDTGLINGIQVNRVYQEEDVVIHVLAANPELAHSAASGSSGLLEGRTEGDQAENTFLSGIIDWDRRFDHMQQHSGEHILSAVCAEVLQAANIGFHLGAESSQIDLNIESISPMQIKLIEQRANEMVFVDAKVHALLLQPDEVGKYDLRKEPVKDFGLVRLVEMDGIDVCPCGGTHVARTGEVGLIKVRSWERRKNGIRLDFVCGWRALTDYQEKHQVTTELSGLLSVPIPEVTVSFKRQIEKLEATNKEIAALKIEQAKSMTKELYREAEETGGVKVITRVFTGMNPADLTTLTSIFSAFPDVVALLVSVDDEQKRVNLAFVKSPQLPMKINMNDVLKSVLPMIGGKGGGSAQLAQGGGNITAKVTEALEEAKRDVVALLKA